ncbi:hypothetical protein [Nocardia cerradoensis]|uniref:Uncharacterized protein n=1 Tax=Nocardia cerradoensis TaxID=85688 RepID=A0A231GT64_9NOCA|nr:hypothetical protein [Nocardia cerradoensis]NKY47971.1 hypothetical protein [Nocardia cerradoensis]OXR39817.1 hypothetical protein B7C42_08105 [Nocardia cerradoensis]
MTNPREVWSPVAVEQRLADIDHLITRGVNTLADAYDKYATLKNQVEVETARAYVNHRGPAHEKKYAAILATEQLRAQLAVADAVYHRARWKNEGLTEQLKAVQSIGASLRSQYEIAGRGAA